MSIDLDAIRQREQAATSGPWTTGAGEAWSDALAPWALVINANYPLIELQEGAQGVADAEFIAHAREDIPALIAEVERLRYERNEANGHIGDLNDEIGRLRAMLAAAVDALTKEATR